MLKRMRPAIESAMFVLLLAGLLACVSCAAFVPTRTLDGAPLVVSTNGTVTVSQAAMADLTSSDVVTALRRLQQVNAAVNPTGSSGLIDSVLTGFGVLAAAFGGWLVRHRTLPKVESGVAAKKDLDS
jgi:hypothetical protein